MRKLVLYAGLGGCFLLALLLERLFTQPPHALGADSALVFLGGDNPTIEIPERPPERSERSPTVKSSRPVGGKPDRSGPAEESKGAGRAPPSPPGPGTGGPSATRRHRVQPNESLWSLAERYLGNGADWPRLQEANGLASPSDLLVGMEIVVPGDSGTQDSPGGANESTRAPGSGETTPPPTTIDRANLRKYTVKAGDTLSEIAQRELGSSKLWHQISELNSLKGEQVEAGDVLLLPPRS